MVREITVLVVDDSIVMRQIITDILEKEGDIKVVGTARNGLEAVQKAKELGPDVVTMDIEMPVMDGITSLQRIMAETPRPVVMLSAVGKRQADLTMRSLELGAVDFIPKTGASLSIDLNIEQRLIRDKVRAAACVKVSLSRTAVEGEISYDEVSSTSGDWVVMIGASTGGPKALPEVLRRLPSNLPAGICIVQHMPEGFTRSFAERLSCSSEIEVKEAQEGDEIMPGVALLAPGNRHMEIIDHKVHLSDGPKIHFVRPAVDVMMRSGARCYGHRSVGVVLTGMGNDGAEGMMCIKRAGGKTIVQDEATSVVYGMPKACVERGCADVVTPLGSVARHIVAALNDVGV
ncbi:MAG: chemotaxis response regulator protein-glutamate methylesterase [Methanomassiliicoccales archaeon]|nr:MAG: chemotaxis response regulator protein-glutamate methylesterase [Methanomassiliicoccales archaeon]